MWLELRFESARQEDLFTPHALRERVHLTDDLHATIESRVEAAVAIAASALARLCVCDLEQDVRVARTAERTPASEVLAGELDARVGRSEAELMAF